MEPMNPAPPVTIIVCMLPPSCTFFLSLVAPCASHSEKRSEDDPAVLPDRPRIDISTVQFHHFFEVSDFIVTVELPQSGDARLHAETSLMMRFIACDFSRCRWPGADETHLAFEYVPELRQLVYV